MEIVTPNHGQLLDTFIMYGIIRSIAQGEQRQKCMERTRIEPEGEFYIIKVNKLDEDKIKKEFFKDIYEAYEKEYGIAREKSPQVAALQKEEETFRKVGEFLKKVKNLREITNISELYGRLSEWSHWRSNRCKLHREKLAQALPKESMNDLTVQMSLSPHLGKYIYKSDEGVRAEQQKVCPLCFSLALLGIMSYSVRIHLIEEGRARWGWQFATLLPTREASAMDLSSFRMVFGKEDKLIVQPHYYEKMPELIIPLLLFKDADTDTMKELQISSPMLYTYRFDSTERAGILAIRKVSEYPALRFIKFYLYVNERASNEDRRFLDCMKQPEYSPCFSELALSVLTGDIERFYNFLRGFTIERGKRTGKPAFFSQVFIEQALRFFQNLTREQ